MNAGLSSADVIPTYSTTRGVHSCTDSRRWAILAWAALEVGHVGKGRTDGSVRLSHPSLVLPRSIGAAVITNGGGIVTRGRDGCLHYAASKEWSPAVALASWISSAPAADPVPVATVRALALQGGHTARAIALLQRKATLTGN